MALTKINIATGTNDNVVMVPWQGHIVAGTEGTLALTRAARHGANGSTVASKRWTVTHVPTGRDHHFFESKTMNAAKRKARRFYKILAKHGVAKNTDAHFIASIVRDEAIRAFG